MTKPHMKLPNGDIIYDGEYGITSDGLRVGPMTFNHLWRAPDRSGAWNNRGQGVPSEHRNIIAKWHPVEPAKRRVIYVINGMTFETARAAKTAYPGCEPVKFKECKK